MISDGVCDYCRWRVTTHQYIDRQGRPSQLCNRCMERAAERRELEVKLDMMHARLRAQQAQYRRLESELDGRADRLEHDLDWFKRAYWAAMERIKRMEGVS